MHSLSNKTVNTTLTTTTGNDTVTTPDQATVYKLTNVYVKYYGGDGQAGNDKITGGYSDDELRGGAGNDTVAGSYGLNQLFGGTGIDTLDYSKFGIGASVKPKLGVDVALRNTGAGVANSRDTNFVLKDEHFEFEKVRGSEYADNVYGNDANNSLSGRAGKDLIGGGSGNDFIDGGSSSDTLVGGLGNDRIYGGSGADKIDGGVGNDVIWGGTGRDVIITGGGKDRIVYKSVSESRGTRETRDLLTFQNIEDKIDLELIDANSKTAREDDFKLIGTKSFSGKAGELRYSYITGTNGVDTHTVLTGDINGDKKADFAIEIIGNRKFSTIDFDL